MNLLRAATPLLACAFVVSATTGAWAQPPAAAPGKDKAPAATATKAAPVTKATDSATSPTLAADRATSGTVSRDGATTATIVEATPTPVPTLPAPVFEEPERRTLFADAESMGLHTPGEIDALVATAKSGGFNRIIADLRTPNGAAYRSSVEPPLSFVSGTFDPWSRLQQAAGLDIECWPEISAFGAFSAVMTSRPPRGSVLAQFPNLACMNLDGKVITPANLVQIDPGNTAAQDYALGIILEAVGKYQPRGIVLTDVNYPGSNWGYNLEAIARFRRAVGGSGAPAASDPTWQAWRRAQLADFLKRVRDEVHHLSPNTKVALLALTDGPAPRSWGDWLKSAPYAERMQDWVSYSEAGLLDEIILVNHRRHYQKEEEFTGWMEFARSHAYKTRLTVSISGDNNIASDIFAQIRLVRTRGLNVGLWNYAKPTRAPMVDFYKSLKTRSFTLKPGAPGVTMPYEHQAESRQFSLMSPPPMSVPMVTPTPEGAVATTKAPTAAPTMAMPEPVKPTATAAPERSFSTITLEGGRTMRARVVKEDQANGEITVQIDGGAMVKIPLAKVVKIERSKR